MKKIIFISILTLLSLISFSQVKKCFGRSPCDACINCNGCKHCNEGKGSCGVCGKPADTSKKHNPLPYPIPKNKKDTTNKKALQCFEGDYFTPLVRTDSQSEKRQDLLKVFTLFYKTEFKDDSAAQVFDKRVLVGME